MSERKKGGLDYTARAFPGARDPDGPAPDLEDKLAKLGLVEREPAKDVRSGASVGANVGANAGAKKRSSLEYTPQAFPGARDPDGPAPDLEERLVQMGLAERAEARMPEPPRRQETSYTPPPPRERAAPSPTPVAKPLPPPRRETVAPPPPARPSQNAPAPARPRTSVDTPAPLRRERVASEPPRPTPIIQSQPQTFAATPQPVYVVPPPAGANTAAPAEPPRSLTPATVLPVVPPEVPPRPAPIVRTDVTAGANADTSTTTQPVPRPATRPARRIAVPKKRHEQEARIRRSVRLVASVDAKLSDLAHLRGLDLNTAVGVAIVTDWVACFGPTSRGVKGQAT